jgi:hypothetical protein
LREESRPYGFRTYPFEFFQQDVSKNRLRKHRVTIELPAFGQFPACDDDDSHVLQRALRSNASAQFTAVALGASASRTRRYPRGCSVIFPSLQPVLGLRDGVTAPRHELREHPTHTTVVVHNEYGFPFRSTQQPTSMVWLLAQ